MREALKSIDVFKDAGSASLDMLERQIKVRTVRKGSHLFFDKDDVYHIFGVLSGCAALYKLNASGEKKVIFVYKQGVLLNEVILHDIQASINCEVLEDSRVIMIPRAVLLEVMEQDFTVCRRVMDSMAVKIRRLYRQLKNTTNSMRGEKKTASKLWKLARDYGVQTDKGLLINMDLSITYLADMLGSKRETVSRQLKMLAEAGLVLVEKNRIYIIDCVKLKDFSTHV